MQFTRSQFIILGSILLVFFLMVGIFTGIIPGLQNPKQKPPQLKMAMWGIEDESFFRDNFNEYEKLRPSINIEYEQQDPATYENDLINALAAGNGPDIAMFHNSWLPKHVNKLIPVDETQLSLKNLAELYPSVIEQDFTSSEKIFALPLYIDTLTLFYNQDIFDKNGIALPPKDWLDLQNLIPKLRQKDTSDNLVKMAAAIGGSEKSIDKASDLLMLLMLQAGAKMTNDDFTAATFADNLTGSLPGQDALNFYKKFSDPTDLYYTWNDNAGYSLDSFAKGNTAMIFNYAANRKKIKIINPFLNFKISEMPQPSESPKAVNYADYWGLAATNNAKNSEWAWDLILFLTVNDAAAERYLTASQNPPALRSLIQKYINHPEFSVFAKQALSARSWPQIEKEQIKDIFSRMISATINNELDTSTALSQAQNEVTELMRKTKK